MKYNDLSEVNILHYFHSKSGVFRPTKPDQWFGFGLVGFNASATARVITRRGNEDDDENFWWSTRRKPLTYSKPDQCGSGYWYDPDVGNDEVMMHLLHVPVVRGNYR